MRLLKSYSYDCSALKNYTTVQFSGDDLLLCTDRVTNDIQFMLYRKTAHSLSTLNCLSQAGCAVAQHRYNGDVSFICGTFYRQDCRVAANCRYCFYSQAKNQVFRPAGATPCTDSGQTLQDRRAPRLAWLCKISRQSVQRAGNAALKISKISTFW